MLNGPADPALTGPADRVTLVDQECGMIDRRKVLGAAAAMAGVGGAAWAGPRAKAPPPRDLTGVWTNAWYTKLQRPDTFKTLAVTPAEAEAYEKPRRAMNGEIASKEDVLGQNESEFPDNGPGLARIRGEIRSSWIVDPSDGKIPWTAAARERLHLDKKPDEKFDNVEDRDTDERCLTTNSAGAPIINSHDANLIQIVQTKDHVAIVTEKNSVVRIIRLAGADVGGPTEPVDGLGALYGVSIGHWEGATLVVETTRLRPGMTKINDSFSLSERARVTERFTRTGAAEINYLFEVDDPTLFSRSWRGEMVFRPAEGRMFEYACHEGNYSLPSILAAARQGNQTSAAEPAKAGK